MRRNRYSPEGNKRSLESGLSSRRSRESDTWKPTLTRILVWRTDAHKNAGAGKQSLTTKRMRSLKGEGGETVAH